MSNRRYSITDDSGYNFRSYDLEMVAGVANYLGYSGCILVEEMNSEGLWVYSNLLEVRNA